MCAQRVIHTAVEKEAVCVRTRKGWGRWGVGRGVPECTKIAQFTGSAELHTDLLTGGGHIDVYLLVGQADVHECGMSCTSVYSGSAFECRRRSSNSVFTCAGVAQFTGRAEVFTNLLTGDYTHCNFTGAGSTGTWKTSQSPPETGTVTTCCW